MNQLARRVSGWGQGVDSIPRPLGYVNNSAMLSHV